MTGGGDLDEVEDDDADVDVADDEDEDAIVDEDPEATDDGDDVAPPVAEAELDLNLSDRIPAAGIADIGGRAGDGDGPP